MRNFSTFQPTLVAMLATTEDVKVTPTEAARYCRALVAADYLRVVEKARPPQREASYRLIRNTGPLPPRLTRVTVLYDDNLNEVAHMPEVTK